MNVPGQGKGSCPITGKDLITPLKELGTGFVGAKEHIQRKDREKKKKADEKGGVSPAL